MQATITKTLNSAVRVTLVADDAEWREEFEDYGYDTDMWAYWGDGACWKDNVSTIAVLEDEEFGFMCGNASDRRCYSFPVTVYKAEEADDTFSFWITEEAAEAIG